MKRIDLIWHLERNECQLLREGSNHTMYVNRKARRSSAVHRVFAHLARILAVLY